MKLSTAILALSTPLGVSSAYVVGGFDMLGRPVVVNTRTGGRRGVNACGNRCGPESSRRRGRPDSVERAFQELEQELNQDRFQRGSRRDRFRRRSGGPSSYWQGSRDSGFPKFDEDAIRKQEEFVNGAFGLASDVVKAFASSEREVKEADEALRQQKEWADRIFGFAKDVSSGGSSSSPRSEVLQDDENMFEVALDVPGVKADDISVTVEGNDKKVLVVRGKRDMAKAEGSVVQTKNISKVIALDDSSDVESISSDLRDGVLIISVPRKSPEPKEVFTKAITVKKGPEENISAGYPDESEDGQKRFELELDVPGVSADNIEIVVEGEKERTLKIEAVREMGKESDGSPRLNRISKSYKVDDLVDVERISAAVSNGVLVISAPLDQMKIEKSVKKIPINSQPSNDEKKDSRASSEEKDNDTQASTEVNDDDEN